MLPSRGGGVAADANIVSTSAFPLDGVELGVEEEVGGG